MQQITAIETADQIVSDSRVYSGSYGATEYDQLRNNLSAIAVNHIEFVEDKAGASTTWPAGQTQASATAELTKLKADVQKPDADVLTLLRRANDVLAWSIGKPAVDAEIVEVRGFVHDEARRIILERDPVFMQRRSATRAAAAPGSDALDRATRCRGR